MPGTPPTRFVYLGPEGTFTEQALRSIPAAEHAVRTPARSVPEALEAVRVGDADAALVPLENSVGGAVPVTLDELGTGSPLVITREVVLPVEFVLASASLTPLASVRSVAAHPQASAQCRGWLHANMPDAVIVDVLSNAAAAVAAAAGEFDAAICAPIGVPRHNLTVLAEKIADRADAVTRFALLSRPAPPAPPTGDDVTSLALMIDHDRVGALLSVLTEPSGASTCPASSPARPASSSASTSSSSTARGMSPSPGSARHSRDCVASVRRCASSVPTPSTAGPSRPARNPCPPSPA
jgi:prephenate dehydratase